MSWAAVTAGKSIGKSESIAGIDVGKTQCSVIATAGETSGGGSSMPVNNAPPAEAAAGGESVAAAGAESPTGTSRGKKKGRHNKKKMVAAVVEGSSAASRDSPDLPKIVESSQAGDSKKITATEKNKAFPDAADSVAKPTSANAKDTGNRLNARGATDGDASTVAAADPKKNKNQGRQVKRFQKLDDFEATAAENKKSKNKKQSAHMKQFEHSLGNSKKVSSVVDTPAEHTKSFVPPTTTSNTGISAASKLQFESTDQAEVKPSKSFRATATLTKPARVSAVGQQDLLDTSKSPLETSKTPINAPENTRQAHNNPSVENPSVKNPLDTHKSPLNALKNALESSITTLSAQNHSLKPPSTTSSTQPSPSNPLDFVTSLNLPGLSHDPFGILISPTAPPWVRGRIARRVQILVSELEQGIQGGTFDPAFELEMEKKERAFFGEEIWDRLFGVEFREKRSDEEVRQELEEMGGLMRGFDEKMEGEREWRAGRDITVEVRKVMGMRGSLLGRNIVDGYPVEMVPEEFVSGNLPNSNPPSRPPPHNRYPNSRLNKHHASPTVNSPPPPPSFSHHRTPRASKLCPYYPRNKCFFGAECRYLHVLPHELELGDVEPPTAAEKEEEEGVHTSGEGSTSWRNEGPGV